MEPGSAGRKCEMGGSKRGRAGGGLAMAMAAWSPCDHGRCRVAHAVRCGNKWRCGKLGPGGSKRAGRRGARQE